jgi:hypothetical protein
MEVEARGKKQRESELGTSAASLKLSRIRHPAGRINWRQYPAPWNISLETPGPPPTEGGF